MVVSAWAPIHQCLLAFEARWWGVSRLIIDQFWSTRSADKKRTLYFDKRSTWSRKSPLLCPLIFQTLLPVDFAPKSGSRVLIEPWEILSTCFVIFVEPEIYWNWSFTWWSSSWKILVTFVCVCLRIFFTEILLKIQTKKVLENPPTAADWTFFRTSKALFTIVTIYVKWMHHLKPFYMQKIGDVLTNFLCCWCKKKFSTDVIWRLNSLEIKKRQFMINPLSKKPIWNLRPFSIFMHMFKASKVFFSIERARPKNNWWSVRWRVYFLWYLNQGLIPCWHRMSSWYKIQLSKKKRSGKYSSKFFKNWIDIWVLSC